MRNVEMKDSGVKWINDIPNNWEIKRLKDFSKIFNGGTPKPEFIFSEKNSDTFYWATPTDFKDIEFNLSKTGRTIDKLKISEAGKLLKKDDLLISCRAPVGKVAYVKEPLSFNQGCKAITIDNKNNAKYYFYCLIASKKYLQELANGTTFQEISTTAFKNALFPVPKLEQQNSIVSYLDAETFKIDRKISILEQKFEKLEEYKQSVIFETVTKGLDNNVPMKDSGIDWIGDIPAHWEVLRLKDSSIIKKGESFDEKLASVEGIYPYINGGINPSDWSNHFNTKENTIAVSEGGASAGYTQFMTTKYWAGSHCYKIQSKNKNSDNKYLFYVLKGFEKYLMIEKTGSAMPNLQKTKFINYLVSFVNDIEEQNKIVDYLDNKTTKINKQKEIIQKKIELLKEYKQTIIYEAVTGKIEIGELYA